MAHGFFAYINSTWNDDSYSAARNAYRNMTPCRADAYFSPLRSVMQTTNLAASLIHSPLWLAVNTVLQIVKAVVNLIVAAVLLPITLAAMIVAPKSDLCADLKSGFKSALANTLVASAMTVLAALATVASLFLKPLQVATCVLATVADKGDDILSSCCR